MSNYRTRVARALPFLLSCNHDMWVYSLNMGYWFKFVLACKNGLFTCACLFHSSCGITAIVRCHRSLPFVTASREHQPQYWLNGIYVTVSVARTRLKIVRFVRSVTEFSCCVCGMKGSTETPRSRMNSSGGFVRSSLALSTRNLEVVWLKWRPGRVTASIIRASD